MAGKWVQKITPYLDDSKLTVSSGGKLLYDWCGWCLAVTDACFGVAPFAASAQVAWNVNPDKHTNIWDMPIGLYVPLFFTGDKQGYGHVVVALRTANDHIKIWSSPYTHKPYFDFFEGTLQGTINTIISKYGLTSCVGWSTVLGNKTIIAWENIPDPVVEPPKPEPTPEPEPEPEPEPQNDEPATDEGSDSNSQEEINTGDLPQPDGSGSEQPPVEVTVEEFIKLLERNVEYMEKVQEIIEEAGNGITFKPLTKKIVYIVCDLLLLAGAEVTPIMTVINAQSTEMFATALTQALFTAGVGGLLIFKLLKAKSGTKLTETIDKTE